MRSTWHPAPSALTGILAGTWSVSAGAAADLSARVLPDGSSCLVFQGEGTVLRSFDDGGRPWGATCVSGPRTGPFDFTLSGPGRILIVQLRPGGAMPVLGVPTSSLADRFEDLEAVVGRCSQVRDAVQGGADDRSCVRSIEDWLLERVRSFSRPCTLTNAAVEEVTRCAGSIRVDDLAGRVNLSRRHLARIMHERIGYTPKLFARVTRFHAAVQQARARPSVPWARVALDSGYADQAHLSREFAALGGIRPRDLRSPAGAMIW